MRADDLFSAREDAGLETTGEEHYETYARLIALLDAHGADCGG
jgi:hypothetical protein